MTEPSLQSSNARGIAAVERGSLDLRHIGSPPELGAPDTPPKSDGPQLRRLIRHTQPSVAIRRGGALGIDASIQAPRRPTGVARRSRSSLFVDLDDLARQVATHARDRVTSVLEIGCGGGEFANHLLHHLPLALYSGIQTGNQPGRRFRGDSSRVNFRNVSADSLRREGVDFDLVVLVDCLQRIEDESARRQLVTDAAALTNTNGLLVVKEWDAQLSVAHGLQVATRRLIHRDRSTRFQMTEYFLEQARTTLPGWRSVWLGGVAPCRNNIVMGWSREAADASFTGSTGTKTFWDQAS